MDKEILRRIEESKRDYDKNHQRAELLKRNKMFSNEFEGISKRFGNEFFKVKNLSYNKLSKISYDNILLKLDYPKIKFLVPSSIYKKKGGAEEYFKIKIQGDLKDSGDVQGLNIEEDSFFQKKNLDLIYEKKTRKIDKIIKYKNRVLERYKKEWEEFCHRWGIDPKWNGNLSRLSKCLRSLVGIWVMDYGYQKPIAIIIGPWTTLEDIKNNWKDIEKLQKEICFKEEQSSNFNRDLCWYDLKREFKLSYSKIAKLWIENCPEDIDLLVIKRIRRKEKVELGDEVALELLDEIKSDSSLKELKHQFEMEKDDYIRGYYSPFMDTIKKSIKRMESRLKKYDLPPEFGYKLYDKEFTEF